MIYIINQGGDKNLRESLLLVANNLVTCRGELDKKSSNLQTIAQKADSMKKCI